MPSHPSLTRRRDLATPGYLPVGFHEGQPQSFDRDVVQGRASARRGRARRRSRGARSHSAGSHGRQDCERVEQAVRALELALLVLAAGLECLEVPLCVGRWSRRVALVHGRGPFDGQVTCARLLPPPLHVCAAVAARILGGARPAWCDRCRAAWRLASDSPHTARAHQ